MTEKTDALRDIFLDVADEATVTERQVDEPSHDPIEGDEMVTDVSSVARHEGLADAVAGAETDGGSDAASS